MFSELLRFYVRKYESYQRRGLRAELQSILSTKCCQRSYERTPVVISSDIPLSMTALF